MKKVQKVAVSIPMDVYEWVEAERGKREVSRSQLMTKVLRQEMHRQELEERARRYEEAYRKHPETQEERELLEWSTREFWEMSAELKAQEKRDEPR